MFRVISFLTLLFAFILSFMCTLFILYTIKRYSIECKVIYIYIYICSSDVYLSVLACNDNLALR